jgi:tetratricopeptide (TPR) repeat protein
LSQAEFEAATNLEAKGDFQGAARALEALAQAHPDDPFADDALFEAAVLAEERLADPARAAKLFTQVAEKYPSSRLARRARARADFLGSSLKSGAGPLVEYQEIVNGAARRPVDESIARMEKLLVANPDFALADRALYWLGGALADQKRSADALARYQELERRFPSSEWAVRAKKSRGELLLRAGKLADARRLFEELAGSSDPLARALAEEGLQIARSSIRRRALSWVCGIYLALFLIGHAVVLWRKRKDLKVPAEVLFYIPIAVIFSLAAATENRSIGWATFAIALGGAAVVYATSSSFAVRDKLTALRGALGVALAAGAVFAVVFLAIQSNQLTDLVIETFRMGPER